MHYMRTKLIGGGLAIAAAVSFLVVGGVREGWVYYLPVDQFIEDASYHDDRVRLHGVVGEENFESSASLLKANFDLNGERNTLRVNYSGVIPDMFQTGRDVVVEGQFDEDGVFVADTLMTKCASKYEAADGEAPHADPHKEQSE